MKITVGWLAIHGISQLKTKELYKRFLFFVIDISACHFCITREKVGAGLYICLQFEVLFRLIPSQIGTYITHLSHTSIYVSKYSKFVTSLPSINFHSMYLLNYWRENTHGNRLIWHEKSAYSSPNVQHFGKPDLPKKTKKIELIGLDWSSPSYGSLFDKEEQTLEGDLKLQTFQGWAFRLLAHLFASSAMENATVQNHSRSWANNPRNPTNSPLLHLISMDNILMAKYTISSNFPFGKALSRVSEIC